MHSPLWSLYCTWSSPSLDVLGTYLVSSISSYWSYLFPHPYSQYLIRLVICPVLLCLSFRPLALFSLAFITSHLYCFPSHFVLTAWHALDYPCIILHHYYHITGIPHWTFHVVASHSVFFSAHSAILDLFCPLLHFALCTIWCCSFLSVYSPRRVVLE